MISIWSFVLERKTLLNQRLKPHGSWLRSLMDYVAENRSFQPRLHPQSIRIHKNHGFGQKLQFLWILGGLTVQKLQFLALKSLAFTKNHGFQPKTMVFGLNLWFFARLCVVFEFKTRKLLISSSVFDPKPWFLLYCSTQVDSFQDHFT